MMHAGTHTSHGGGLLHGCSSSDQRLPDLFCGLNVGFPHSRRRGIGKLEKKGKEFLFPSSFFFILHKPFQLRQSNWPRIIPNSLLPFFFRFVLLFRSLKLLLNYLCFIHILCLHTRGGLLWESLYYRPFITSLFI